MFPDVEGVILYKRNLFLFIVMMVIVAACKPVADYPTHVLEPRYKHVLDNPATNYKFADLQGNGEDMLILADAPASGINSLYVRRLDGSIVS